MKLDLKPWLQNVVDCGGETGKDRGSWVIVRRGQIKANNGLNCMIHDGKNQMLALISKKALTEFENKRGLSWDSTLSHKICCLKYELKNYKINILEPYLCILSLDSLGNCGSPAESLEPLPIVNNSKLWKLKSCKKASNWFNEEHTERFEDIDKIVTDFHNPDEKIDWGDTPLPISQEDFCQTQLVFQGCASSNTKNSWGETPISHIVGENITKMETKELYNENESFTSNNGDNLPGCKHNPLKTCYLCLLKRTKVPKKLYNVAKRQNFQCSCKK